MRLVALVGGLLVLGVAAVVVVAVAQTSGGISGSSTCADWLAASPGARIAYIQNGTAPTVSRSFAAVAARYGSATCRHARAATVPPALQMVNLASASGHTNVYGH